MRLSINVFVRSVLVLSLVLLSGAPGRAQEGQSLVFDLIEIPLVGGHRVNRWAMTPVPRYLVGETAFDLAEGDEGFSHEWIHDFALDLIRQHVAPEEWENPERFLEVTSDGRRIAIRAPEEVVRETRVFMRYLHRALLEAFEIEVTVYRMGDGDGPDIGSPRLSRTDADRVVAVAGDSLEKVLSRTVPLHPGRAMREASHCYHPVVIDYDVEIADTSVNATPVSIVVEDEVKIVGRATRAETGGAIVDLAVVLASVDRIDEKRLGSTGTIVGGDRLLEIEIVEKVQSAALDFVSAASRLHVLEGTSAFLLLGSSRFTGAERWLVRVDGPSRSPESDRWFKFSSGSKLGLFDDHLPPIRTGPVRSAILGAHHYTRFRSEEDGYSLSAFFPESDEDAYGHLVSQVIPFDGEEQQIHRFGPWLFVIVRGDTEKRLLEIDRALEKPLLSSGLIEVDLLRRSDGGEETVARCAMPVAAGAPFVGVQGRQWTEVLGYDIEVSQRAAVADPYVSLLHDAVLFRGEVDSMTAERASLRLQMKAQLLRGEPGVYSSDHPTVGTIAQPSFDEIFVDRELDLVVGRPVTIGDLRSDVDGDATFLLRVVLKR